MFSNLEERWVPLEEIAKYLGVSKDTIYLWISNKEPPTYKMGRLWKFKTSEIDEWVKSRKAVDNEK